MIPLIVFTRDPELSWNDFILSRAMIEAKHCRKTFVLHKDQGVHLYFLFETEEEAALYRLTHL